MTHIWLKFQFESLYLERVFWVLSVVYVLVSPLLFISVQEENLPQVDLGQGAHTPGKS